MENKIIPAFALTLFAGLAAGIGSLIALFAKRTNTKFLSVSLGFSGGVMVYVSMAEPLAEAKNSLSAFTATRTALWRRRWPFSAE